MTDSVAEITLSKSFFPIYWLLILTLCRTFPFSLRCSANIDRCIYVDRLTHESSFRSTDNRSPLHRWIKKRKHWYFSTTLTYWYEVTWKHSGKCCYIPNVLENRPLAKSLFDCNCPLCNRRIISAHSHDDRYPAVCKTGEYLPRRASFCNCQLICSSLFGNN